MPTVNRVIEEARQLMYKLADIYGREHPIVLAQSEILDELILVEHRS
jgi:hypothetical protein